MTKYICCILIGLCLSSCSNAQTDKVLATDTLLKINVLQSDLDKYIEYRKFTDTTGKTTAYLKIIRNAKVRMSGFFANVEGQGNLPYEEAIKRAEAFFELKNMVNKVLVVKSERKMYLLKDGKTVKTFTIALGPNPVGQKQYEGDGRTPEGTYTLDWQRWETPVFHSFHISYPNQQDIERAKNKGLTPGSNIMVHGTSKGIKKKKDWTNGCIGLNNTDMIEFRRIVFQDTPIEITK
jgi:murein L,D-transpeptidase YafK